MRLLLKKYQNDINYLKEYIESVINNLIVYLEYSEVEAIEKAILLLKTLILESDEAKIIDKLFVDQRKRLTMFSSDSEGGGRTIGGASYNQTPPGLREMIYQEQPKFLPEDDIILFEDIIKTLTNIGGDVYGIMHTWFQDSYGGLKIIKDHWSGPMMYYPEIHKFDTSTHEAIATCNEDEFANSCLEFIDDQIQIIGGCCGVSDNHLKKLIEKF